MLVNPGGPGASGIEIASQLALLMKNTEVARKFDLVGFDPRGIGASTPTIHCLTAAEQDAQRTTDILDPSPAGVARAEAASRQTADGCAQKTGASCSPTSAPATSPGTWTCCAVSSATSS